MSEEEFDLIDELYFVQSYSYLKETLHWEDEKLLAILQDVVEKDWVKCFFSPDEEVFEKPDLLKDGRELYYLATKKGLLRHNTL